MKTRTALAAILSLAAVAGVGATTAFAKPTRAPEVHSYILLDRTGSMEPIWTEALSSVNAYADGLATLDGGPRVNADITLAAFDAQDGLQFDVLRKDISASDWKDVTNKEISPRGMTPLYDAIGRMVSLAEKDKPEKAVIVIMTDGEENSSKEMTKASAKAALDRVRAKGWEVVFLGTEFSNFDDATGVGQTASRNMAVSKDQLSDSMNRLAQKSRDYATGAAPSVEWNAEDRAAAKEEEVKQRNNGSSGSTQRTNR
ncbi:MAG TPA: vWA domain-containing protein [Hyphomonadaceae bacterium]|nr:vWA domain-containing protein [Hyphomonadaceae bacterium]HPN05683.1 vWA domain-containing protein [Hyphomonadaceae bacterium]